MVSSFDDVLFFDQLVNGFFDYLRIENVSPPKIRIKEDKERFLIDVKRGMLTISPKFLAQYDKLPCGSVILHQVFHNYCQNILTFDDVKAIRSLLGKNIMFYVDIVADVYTFLFFERYYDYSFENYAHLCYQLLKEYQNDTIETSKFTRLIGSALTIANREGQSFDVFLPILGEATYLRGIKFSRSLNYFSIILQANTISVLGHGLTDGKCSEKEFVSAIQKVISTMKGAK